MIRFLAVLFLTFMFGVTSVMALTSGDGGIIVFCLLFAVLSVMSAMVFIGEERLAGR